MTPEQIAAASPRTSARLAGVLYLPRFIGALLMIEGICYLANSLADFVAPEIASTVLAVLMVSGLAEVVLCVWLLVFGVNEQRWKEQALSVEARS